MGIIQVLKSFDRALASLSFEQRAAVETAIQNLRLSFGKPHDHTGIGIKSFGRLYECRVGIGLRILFRVRDGTFYLVTVGTHDQLRAFLKDMR